MTAKQMPQSGTTHPAAEIVAKSIQVSPSQSRSAQVSQRKPTSLNALPDLSNVFRVPRAPDDELGPAPSRCEGACCSKSMFAARIFRLFSFSIIGWRIVRLVRRDIMRGWFGNAAIAVRRDR